MPRLMRQPRSIYACFLRRDFLRNARQRRGPDAVIGAAPIQRSRPKCHCPLAGVAAKHVATQKTRCKTPRFTFLFSFAPGEGGSGVGGKASTVVVATRPRPLAARGRKGEGAMRANNQLAAAAG